MTCFLTALPAQAPFTFEGQNIPPGEKAHFRIPISNGAQKTFIPVTVFHGREEGPVLGITAGVHGYEYPPILAGQRLIEEIGPARLSGTVLLVQVANVEGFLGRSPYLNPLDGKNLNRSFPGRADGSITERIAHYLSEKVIARCDYFLDMHGGDAPEDLMPYAAYYQHDQYPDISAKGRAMATHLGFDHVVIFQTTEKDYMQPGQPSTYCSAQAFKMGIPAIDIECGKLGQSDAWEVEAVAGGVQSLLRHLDMVPGSPLTSSGIAFIEHRTYLSSAQDGFFYPLKSGGDYVLEGMKLGYVTDFFHRPQQDIFADQDGVLLLILGTPPVNRGETVAVIGRVQP